MFHPLWHCRICTPGLAQRVKATTETRRTRYVIMCRFAGTQHEWTFLQSSFSLKTLYALRSEVSSFSSYVSLMRLSSLIRALHDTHCHSLWTGLGNPYRCFRHMSCRYRKQCTTSTTISVKLHVLTTRPPTGHEL